MMYLSPSRVCALDLASINPRSYDPHSYAGDEPGIWMMSVCGFKRSSSGCTHSRMVFTSLDPSSRFCVSRRWLTADHMLDTESPLFGWSSIRKTDGCASSWSYAMIFWSVFGSNTDGPILSSNVHPITMFLIPVSLLCWIGNEEQFTIHSNLSFREN